MMPASAQGATKLLETLEKLSRWAGDPPGDHPSGAPAGELVRAFEEVLSPPSAGADVPGVGEGSVVAPPETVPLPGPAEAMPSLMFTGTTAGGELPSAVQVGTSSGTEPPAGAGPVDVPAGQAMNGPQAVFQGEGIPRQDILDELGRLLERVSGQGALVSPAELLRMQQLVGMLNVQAKAGVQTSQQTTQGLESLLRQSG